MSHVYPHLAGRRRLSVPLAGLVDSEWAFYPELVLAKSPVMYWPLTEPKVSNAPYFYSTNPEVTLPHAALETPFDGAEGSISVWLKVNNSAVWTDGVQRRAFYFYIDLNSYVMIYKPSGSNVIAGVYRAGGATAREVQYSISSTNWIHVVVTWSAGADEVKIYVNGTQRGSTLNSIGTWPASALTIAAFSEDGGTLDWYGWLAHGAIWNSAISSANVTTLYQAGAPSAGYEDVVMSLSPFAYWPLNEKTGTNADNYEGTASYDGTYSGAITLADAIFADYPTIDNAQGSASYDATAVGILLADNIHLGQGSPFWDGALDRCDIPAAVGTDIPRTAGTLSMWCKVPSGVWTDATDRSAFCLYNSDTEYLIMWKRSVSNEFALAYVADAVASTQVKSSLTTTDWFHIATTWDTGADEVKHYWNGVQEGATKTGIGTLYTSFSTRGIGNRASNWYWHGWLQHCAIFNSALPLADIQELALV